MSSLHQTVEEYLRIRRALGFKLESAGGLLPQFLRRVGRPLMGDTGQPTASIDPVRRSAPARSRAAQLHRAGTGLAVGRGSSPPSTPRCATAARATRSCSTAARSQLRRPTAATL